MIPLSCEDFSIKGLRDFIDTLHVIKERPNTKIKLLGSFLNLYDARKLLHQGIGQDMANYFGELLFDTKVRQSIKISEANYEKLPIFIYAKNSPVAEDFGNLFSEAHERLNSLFTTDILADGLLANSQQVSK
jgi:chromosome partitioning protein